MLSILLNILASTPAMPVTKSSRPCTPKEKVIDLYLVWDNPEPHCLSAPVWTGSLPVHAKYTFSQCTGYKMGTEVMPGKHNSNILSQRQNEPTNGKGVAFCSPCNQKDLSSSEGLWYPQLELKDKLGHPIIGRLPVNSSHAICHSPSPPYSAYVIHPGTQKSFKQ